MISSSNFPFNYSFFSSFFKAKKEFFFASSDSNPNANFNYGDVDGSELDDELYNSPNSAQQEPQTNSNGEQQSQIGSDGSTPQGNDIPEFPPGLDERFRATWEKSKGMKTIEIKGKNPLQIPDAPSLAPREAF